MDNEFNNNIDLNNNQNSFTMIKIIVLLTTFQIIRILSKQIVFIFVHKNEFNEILISIIVMILLGVYIIYKAKKEDISLNIFSYMNTKESKIYYILLTSLILFLIITSPSFIYNISIYTLIPLIYSTIIIPIYEELIFRSYLWSILEKEYKNEFKVYLITTILFSLWHVGYADSIIMKIGFNNIAFIMFIKCSLMISYGLIIGFLRYKIKNSYSSMLIHSFINIFGR